jgi:spore coat protein H
MTAATAPPAPGTPKPPRRWRRTAALLLASSAAATACATGDDRGDAVRWAPPGGWEPEVLHLHMDEEDLRELYTRPPFDDDRLDGVVVRAADGEELAVDGLRFRGSSSRVDPKKSFNIRFEEGQDFLFGSNRMNLKAMWTDPTLAREVLAMSMWHELGHPAPRTAYVDLHVGDTFEGLYLHVERVDGDLLAHAGLDPDGTLVRDELRSELGTVESAFGLSPEEVADTDELAALLADTFNSRGQPDWDAVAELVAAVVTTDAGPDFEDLVAERFEDDVLIDWLALHVLTGDLDSFGDDYWLYLDDGDPDARWVPIPWDKDLAFGSHFRTGHGTANDFFAYDQELADAAEAWQNGLVEKILATPPLAERLEARTLELTRSTFTPRWFDELLGQVTDATRTSLETGPGPGRFVLHPANHHGELGRLDQHVESISDWVELRWAHLAAVRRDTGATSTASVDLDPDDAGRRVLLTDGDGWTIAALDVADIEGSGTLTVAVEPSDAGFDVDRVWDVEIDGATVRGTLDLYYRNDVDGENWYVEDDAVGDQAWLQVHALDDPDEPLAERTRANPFSNKASTEVVLDGAHRYALTVADVGLRTLADDDPDD